MFKSGDLIYYYSDFYRTNIYGIIVDVEDAIGVIRFLRLDRLFVDRIADYSCKHAKIKWH